MLLLGALGASWVGCTIIAATRAPTPERGADACSNFVDDDLDDTVDCDDVDCDGVCPEEALGPCTDGRDNDGDGVIDGADPRCWHVLPPAVTRCATVVGSHVEPAIEEGALIWRGLAQIVPDPRGDGGSVFAALGDRFRIAPVASSTGALDGLRVTATVRVSRDVETAVALVPAGELGDATTAGVFTRFVRLTVGRSIYLATDRATGRALIAPPQLDAPRWADLDLTILGRSVRGTIRIDGGVPVDVGTLELPTSFVDPLALDAIVQADTAASAEVPMLASLSIDRVGLPACDRDELVPEMRADGFDLVLDVARGGADGTLRCALTADNGRGRAYSAAGDADWRAAPAVLQTGGLIGAAIAWDPDRQVFVGVTASGADVERGTEPASFARLESADCVSFDSAPLELPQIDPSIGLSARGMSYVIEPSGAHVLRLLADRALEVGVLALESEDGSPDHFAMVGDLRAVGPAIQALVSERAAVGIEVVGQEDVVLMAMSSRGLVVLTPRGTAGRLAELPAPLLGPSDVAGTFDRGLPIGPPRLLPSSSPAAARVYYGGTSFGNYFGCVTSGSALFSIVSTR